MGIGGIAKRYFKSGFFVLLTVAVFFIWYVVFVESRQKLTVAFLDVGQGDAILIDTPGDQQILIDGGLNKQVLAELSKVMPFYDRSIDVVIATHPDQDHISGLLDVLERYEVDFVVEPGVESATAVYEGLENLIGEKGINKTRDETCFGRECLFTHFISGQRCIWYGYK